MPYKLLGGKEKRAEARDQFREKKRAVVQFLGCLTILTSSWILFSLMEQKREIAWLKGHPAGTPELQLIIRGFS